MTVFKCKMCGGQTTLDSKNGIAVCEYCGTKQVLSLFSDDSERLLYESGNNYLSHNEYDKAENVFNQLLTIKPNAAELYWDLVLCKYGVTYVKDPKTDKYIPTCNRTHYASIFNDENYNKAIEYANDEQKALFEEDAKYIDDVQKGIVAIAKSEKPFDIFICYKETAQNGARSKDSVKAQKLYEKLTEAGYKVFFSRITLEDKIGTEYEPYIYAALASSKVMITIGSSKENFEATWVKNEWSRFLGFIQSDNSKTLLPLYFDMDKSKLPDEFALLSAYDMQIDGFIEDLLRGIKKLIPLPIMKARRRKQIRKAFWTILGVIAVIIGITAAILIPKELEKKQLQQKYDAAEQLLFDGKYAQATWLFDELGDYEDSVEQSQKAERKWRESLAVPVIRCVRGSSGFGSNYITPNGEVESLDNKSTFEFEFGKNGRAISITSEGAGPIVLYENGYVDEKNQDVIQITEGLCALALKKDGTVSSLRSDENYTKFWQSKDLAEWENIIELSYCHYFTDTGGVGDFCIIGIKDDGTIEWILGTCFKGNNYNDIIDYLNSVKDVKKIAVSISYEEFMIAKLDSDNTLHVYNNGKQEKYDDASLADFEVFVSGYDGTSGIVGINEKRQLFIVGEDKFILEDVVRLTPEYCVTQTGTIYELGLTCFEIELGEENLGKKTKVHDVWLERK